MPTTTETPPRTPPTPPAQWGQGPFAQLRPGVRRYVFGTEGDTGALIARLGLALVMFPHGAQKLMGAFGGDGFAATYASFTGMGIPAPLAVVEILTEFFAPLLLAVGFLSRIAALGIGAIMVVAVALVHWEHGFFMNWTGAKAGEGFEFHILAIALALVVLVRGGGRWSLDRYAALRMR